MNITIFTDGACKNNGGVNVNKEIKGAIGIYFPNKELPDISRVFRRAPITNQRAELYAVYIAILNISKKLKNVKNINIYTDSMYTIRIFTEWIDSWIKNKFENIKNQDIIKSIYKLSKNYKISYTHVKAHTNKGDKISQGNAKADSLANKAIK